MNKLGVHALVWTGGWTVPEARHAISSSATAGFDLIEIPVLDPASIDTAVTRRLLEEHGLGVTCSLGLSLDADISSADKAVAARGLALLRDALHVARDVGSKQLCGVLYSALAKYPAPMAPEGRQNCIDALRSLADEAEATGVSLNLEVVNRYETNVINTADEALALIDEIGSPNVRIHLDTYHMNIEETDFATPVVRCGPRLGYVHVGEGNRGYLGAGTVDWPTFFDALTRIDYQGVITFESFSSAVVSPGLSNTLAIWRNLWTDGMDLALHARGFVTDGMEAARQRVTVGQTAG
jgi:D-psicose/D-tagatose/L-ribulose 3-epimerase